ncbi:flavin monoamine oxidase family protein [Pseudomonas granadensis]|uniref:flavin monoamine oxidase family protein n=1 Tax=Pseudomonas granadensis TaxID=1421430 RepID=UPI0019D237BC|nr:flavin monoamine oxidase family protein [Pseudomonas granadensis]MBN6771835.1 flavin monoamine oxidase family protein [Pseudomonas granadensis]MBN6803389.1 flavin monoamine oxidase family protein [Pseudomonas granadensis]MBN6829686.1 flavin monoamine oxidase family protein [Pseudomonas granadensis]MBN6837610.1 flavin monoamine oxidase family protein [Pseudomonas granadensis]MBN6866256.1 flavin monoamine oxidase family protein [Pseudomonas granadensis]
MSVGWLRACALVMLGLFSVTALAKDKTAIVIGGGLSGLTAAYELQNKGWQVTLLEAKPSLGGRSGMATSEWIGNDKTQPVLNKYVSTFKLGTTPAPEFVRTPSYLIDGDYFSAADLATKQPATADALKRYQKTLDDLARSIDDPQNPAATATLHALDQITVSSWLDKQNLPATARQLINQDIRTHYDEPSRLSLLYFAQQNRVYRGVSDRDLRASRLVGGSQVLAQAFVKQIKTIKTNSPVSAITQDKDGVTVKVGSVGYQADYVVLAVPLRALNKIALTPALDAQHLAAIKGTNYGWRDQIMLKFKTPVWESKARMSGEIYSNTGLGMLWIEPALKGGANVVINLSGDNARVMQAFGDKQMVDQVLIRLHAFYPQARGSFTGYEIRRYSTDPSMGGAYLAYGPGQISKFWRLWERPLQRVAFAGEHTDTLYPGTLEGALRTGQRAASQLEDLAAGKSFEPVKVVPAAAAAGAAGAAAAKKGNFFSNLFGGSDDEKKPEPVKAPEPAPAPVAPAPAPTPAPALVEAPKPAAPVKAEPAKKAAAKPAAKKPAAKTETKKPAAKPAAKKAEPAKKPAAKPAATTETKAQ